MGDELSVPRLPNALLIALTTDTAETSYHPDWAVTEREIGAQGLVYYPDCILECLTPGSNRAIATGLEYLTANVWESGSRK